MQHTSSPPPIATRETLVPSLIPPSLYHPPLPSLSLFSPLHPPPLLEDRL